MSVESVIIHHAITPENMDALSHMTGKKRGGGCESCHCKTPKYAAWNKIYSFTCCNECFAKIKIEAQKIADREAARKSKL